MLPTAPTAVHLQLKDNPTQNAKRMTQEEFEDNMRLLVERATAYWEPKGKKPLFMFDNDFLQKYADKAKIGLRRDQKINIPAHSPDFNQMIEHVFNRLKRDLRDMVPKANILLDGLTVQEMVLQLWKKHTTAKVIAADARKLPLTFRAVGLNEGVEKDVVIGRKTYHVVGTGGNYSFAHH